MAVSNKSHVLSNMAMLKSGTNIPINGTKRTLPIDKLIEDPDNSAIYGEYETEGLSESIKENGFKGVLQVYPDPNQKGKYMIESGHRSLDAARKAGLSEVPVIINNTPASDIERRKRLILANLHLRRYTPLRMAKQAAYLVETYQKEASETGKSISMELVKEKVSKDLEMTATHIDKYLRILQLNEDLQKLADTENVSWTALIGAATLNNEQQKELYKIIKSKKDSDGSYINCTRTWIANTIKNLTSAHIDKEKNSKEPKSRTRKANGVKYIDKIQDAVKIVVGEDSFIYEKDKEKSIRMLKEVISDLTKKLEELEGEE